MTAIAERRLQRLVALQHALRDRLREAMAEQSIDQLSRAARDDDGDTIFGIDVDAEEQLLVDCEAWAKAEDECFVLIAEGLEPEGRILGRGTPTFRLIVDPIDGTRGLMFDKRSAWCLAAIAPDRGPTTSLADVELAVMSELPTTRQAVVDTLWVAADGVARGRRQNLYTGRDDAFVPKPSGATTLRHGFATVCAFFQGGKELLARVDEDFMARALDGWRADKAELYADQYISSGGQLAELILGRDRFVVDLRPWIHRKLGHPETLCSRPYDLCTVRIATAAGCVVTAPDGAPLDAPLDTTTNLAFVGYANPALAGALQPHLAATLAAHGLRP